MVQDEILSLLNHGVVKDVGRISMSRPQDKKRRPTPNQTRRQPCGERIPRKAGNFASSKRETRRKRRTRQPIDPEPSVTNADKPENLKCRAERKRKREQQRAAARRTEGRQRTESRRAKADQKKTRKERRHRAGLRCSSVLHEQAPTTRRLGATLNPGANASGERLHSTSREIKRFRTKILRENVEIREAERTAQVAKEKQEALEVKRKMALSDPIDATVQYSEKGERIGVDSRFSLALVILGAVGFGIVVMVLMREDKKSRTKPTYVAKRSHRPKQTKPVKNLGTETQHQGEGARQIHDQDRVKAPKSIEFVEEQQGTSSGLSVELLNKSEHHKTLASFLDEFTGLHNQPSVGTRANPFEGYRERQRRENDLLEQIKNLGPGVLTAMSDLITELSGHPFQMFLARVLGSMDNDTAREKSAKLLVELKAYSVRMQLVKALPRNDGSIDMIGKSIGKVDDANLRVMLVRELALRTRDGENFQRRVASEHFRKLALEDQSPTVRAEAIAVIGRRKLKGVRDILEQIVRSDGHSTVRQRAIVSLARTAGESSMQTLEEVAMGEAKDSVRASAVLGLTLIGKPALRVLEDIARGDNSPDIRQRAQRAIQAIQRTLASSSQESSSGQINHGE